MRLNLILATVVVIVLTLIPAFIDGERRFRWGEDKEVVELAERLNRFPARIGSWETLSDLPIGKAATDMLQPFATINRIYFNASKQAKANVFILLGPTGPTAVHTPDICFASRDFQMLGGRRAVSIGSESGGNSKSFLVQFQSRDVNKKFLETWYAWTVNGTWQCPQQPRFYFANNRFLFKIQIVAEYASRQEMEDNQTFEEFVTTIERTLRKELF